MEAISHRLKIIKAEKISNLLIWG